MANMLLTDWITIGTSGPTIDGREISADDLQKMAKNYDPAVYTAVINLEHYYGNLGTVQALRVAPGVLGETALQARFAPNKYYLQYNADGNKLFTSMEITRNFRQSGEPYLSGLAATDTPASIGTTEIHFSKKDDTVIERSKPLEISTDVFKSCREENGTFQEFFNKLGEFFAPGKQHKDQDDMTKDDVQSIVNDTLKPVTEKLATVLEKLENFAKKEKPATPPVTEKKTETTAPTEGKSFDFEAAFNKLGADLKAVTDKLSAALGEKPGTAAPATTGAAGNDAKFV